MNSDSIKSSLSIPMPEITFSCLGALGNKLSTIVDSSRYSEHFCLFLNLRGNVSSVLAYMYIHSDVKIVSLNLDFLSVFIMNVY